MNPLKYQQASANIVKDNIPLIPDLASLINQYNAPVVNPIITGSILLCNAHNCMLHGPSQTIKLDALEIINDHGDTALGLPSNDFFYDSDSDSDDE